MADEKRIILRENIQGYDHVDIEVELNGKSYPLDAIVHTCSGHTVVSAKALGLDTKALKPEFITIGLDNFMVFETEIDGLSVGGVQLPGADRIYVSDTPIFESTPVLGADYFDKIKDRISSNK